MIFHRAVLVAAALATLSGPVVAQTSPIPRMISQNGRHALLVDGAPFLMLGAQVNNSSAWPSQLPKVWPVIAQMHANTVEVPIAWEQIEATERKFDFSFLDLLLEQARANNVRLVLLWFGTWKNTAPGYAPAWVKLDQKRFPRMVDAKGATHYALSPFGTATLAADRRAFVALMEHIKAADAQHTVIMVQPENEAGSYGSVRDYSPAAQRAFDGPAPAALVRKLKARPGSWKQAFGANADEYFHAWSIASYIEAVAAAGKAVKPLPMYANAALSDPFKKQDPATYASGGPTHDVIDVWKVAAPSLDVLAPDIYTHDHARYIKYLELYGRTDNALLVPETGNSADYARFFFPVVGAGGIGFAPFGMDLTGYSNFPLGARELDAATIEAFAMNYRLFGPMQRVWAKLALTGKTWGVAEPAAPAVVAASTGPGFAAPTAAAAPAGNAQVMALGRWQAIATFGRPQFGIEPPKGNPTPMGGVAIAELSPDEYLVTAVHARVEFALAAKGGRDKLQFLRVEEGHFDPAGAWVFDRLWNGDQTDYGLNFSAMPQVLKVRLATYR